MHRLSNEGLMVGGVNCIGVSVFGAQGKFHEEFLRWCGCVSHYLGECIRSFKDVLCQGGAFTVMGGFHTSEASSPTRT
eukprot:10914009-Ditylum_brightwellii.AAC.1